MAAELCKKQDIILTLAHVGGGGLVQPPPEVFRK